MNIPVAGSQRLSPLEVAATLLIMVSVHRVHEVPGAATAILPFGKLLIGVGLLAVITNRNVRAVTKPLLSKPSRWFWIYIAAMILSLPLSVYRSATLQRLIDTLPPLVGFVIVLVAAVRTPHGLRALSRATTLGIAVLGVAAMAGVGSYQEGGRTSVGEMYDPNDIALVAVVSLPFALQQIRTRGVLWKIVGILGTAAAMYIIVKSGSRGGFIGTGTVLLVFIFSRRTALALRWRIITVVVALAASPLLPNSFYERLDTFADIEQEYNFTAQIGRVQLAKRGMEHFITHPLTGVGYGQFAFADGMWARERGIETGFKWHQPHNVYVQAGAELGAIGLIGLLGMLLMNLRSGRVAMRLHKAGKMSADEFTLVYGVELATIGFMCSATFLSAAYSPVLMLLSALGIAVRARVVGPSEREVILERRRSLAPSFKRRHSFEPA